MSAKHVGLGRGLGALIKDTPTAEAPAETGAGIIKVPVGHVKRSPWQPRHHFEQEAHAEMVESIRERGVLQPLLLRRTGLDFQLIAGERRLRAALDAGLTEVPAILMDVSDREALELALVENLQRADLNLIEEAEGYRALSDKFGMTQEDIAHRVGKARPTVTNALRLLDLPDRVKRLVAERQLSPGHAKALLGIEIHREQEILAERVIEESLSVRTLERIVARLRRPPKKPRAQKQDIPEEHLRDLVDRMHEKFGTSVRLLPSKTLSNGKKVKGRLEIDFYSADDLDRLLVLLGMSDTL